MERRWFEGPDMKKNVERLSPECRDLLDRIFVVDPKKRITITQIMQHPWYNLPLPPRYQQALNDLQGEQAAMEKRANSIRVDEHLLVERSKAIEQVIEEAMTLPSEVKLARGQGPRVRPLHVVNLGSPHVIKRVDLSLEAVAARAVPEE